MKPWIFLLAFLVLLLVASAIGLVVFLSSPSQSADQATPVPQAQNTSSADKTSLPVPSGACQSRLWGKITNATTGQAPANTTVDVDSGGRKFKTVTDANGLYGFAGMCAGDYTITVTPAGGKPTVDPNKVTLDGKQQNKVDLSFK